MVLSLNSLLIYHTDSQNKQYILWLDCKRRGWDVDTWKTSTDHLKQKLSTPIYAQVLPTVPDKMGNM